MFIARQCICILFDNILTTRKYFSEVQVYLNNTNGRCTSWRLLNLHQKYLMLVCHFYSSFVLNWVVDFFVWWQRQAYSNIC